MQTALRENAAPTEPDEAADPTSGRRPTSSDDALRLAIKLAVDEGDYARAAALLDVARRGA